MLGFFIKNKTSYIRNRFHNEHHDWWATQIEWSKHAPINLKIIKELDESVGTNEDPVEMCKTIKYLQNRNKNYNTVRNKIRGFLRNIYRTKKEFDVYKLLACPICKNRLIKMDDYLLCNNCGHYPIVNKVPILLKDAIVHATSRDKHL